MRGPVFLRDLDIQAGEEARMFLFFSNQVGLFGSIAISILLTLILLYACSI
jgi:hypothetical protein